MMRYLLMFLCFVSLTLSAQHVPTRLFDVEKRSAIGKMNNKSAPQTSDYNVHYYKIDLVLDPAVRFVQGNITVHFEALTAMDSIVLDFGNQLVVDSIVYHQITYLTANTNGFNTVSFVFPSRNPSQTYDSVQVFYKGTPSGNPVGTPFARVNVPNGNLIWTLSEPYGASDWWPCKSDLTDKADSISIQVTVPQGNKVASLGLLQGIDTIGTNLKYKWKTTYPTAAYLVAIGAGKYNSYQDQLYVKGDSILMEHYLFQNESQGQSLVGVQDFMVLFDSLFGEYPFKDEKYGHASFTFGGGMEHQTISFMGSYGGGLKAHELAHQWFGNKITCGSWSDLWLNESFATYITGLTYEFGVVHNTLFWQVWLDQTKRSGFAYPNGSVYRYDTSNVNSLFNNQVYNKGAITLHTLRWKIGDSAFFAGVKNYISDSSLAFGFARTPDLKAHFEASYGQSLTEFFNDWIYGPGYPQMNTTWSVNGSNLTLNVYQLPSDTAVSFFEIPIPYRLTGNNLDTIIVVNPSANNQTFNIPNLPGVTNVIFNPDDRIFAKELITVEISEAAAAKKLAVFPNPTRDYLYFENKADYIGSAVRIYSLEGKLVQQQRFNQYIDVSNLSNCFYVIEIEGNNEVQRTKFQKIN
ncbi:M1 family aminopeptidase [Vicingaceae bacterium]|nr:M1 family aminopeptidase [Vicingaceae bacterium]